MRLLLVGYNDGVLSALDNLWPESVVVLEERDLWERKNLAAKARGHASVAEVHFAKYQQHEQFLELLPSLGPVDAVAPGLEYAVPAAARAARALGKPGAGPSADVLCDKLRLRRAIQDAGMASPRFQQVTSAGDIRAFSGGAACVVKPANRQASLGVVLLDDGADVDMAWKICTEADEGVQVAMRPMQWRYLVEERLYGSELSTECLVSDGVVRFLNVTSKRTAAGARPVEVGHIVPGGRHDDWQDRVVRLIAAIGFRTGILHAEWIVGDGGPLLIECAGRPPGDRIIDLIDLAYGINLTELWVRLLAGEDVAVPTRPRTAASIRFVTASPGVVREIWGVEEARALPGVRRVDIIRRPGDELGDLRSSWDRIGSAVAVADTPYEAEQRACRAVEQIHVDLADQPRTL